MKKTPVARKSRPKVAVRPTVPPQTPESRKAALIAHATAEAKKTAAEAVRVEAERLRHLHEATVAEHDRLRKEHEAAEAEAVRLAGEESKRVKAAHDALPWHKKIWS